MVEWDHSFTRQVDQVIGAFFFIRRFVFESLGGFDERFYVYFEEVDLSFRAKQEGWNSVYLAEAQAFHSGGGSSSQAKAHRLFYSLRSRIIYSFKHFNAFEGWSVCMVTLAIEPITRLVRCIARGSVVEALDTLRGFFMLWKDTPKILSKRIFREN
jgi:GT2 family glycosyltransferase